MSLGREKGLALVGMSPFSYFFQLYQYTTRIENVRLISI